MRNHRPISEETREKLRRAALRPEMILQSIKNLPKDTRGEKNSFYGKHHTEETKRKLSEANRKWKPSEEWIKKRSQLSREQWQRPEYKEKMRKIIKELWRDENYRRKVAWWSQPNGVHPLKGKRHSPETRKKISVAHQGKKLSEGEAKRLAELSRTLARDKDFTRRRILKSMRGMSRRPTKPELILMDIARVYNLPLKYNDKREKILLESNGHYLAPDFIVEGRKIAIEVYGDYWHSPILRPNIRLTQRPEIRQNLYNNAGWTVIPIWESELKNKGVPDIVNNIRKYL